MSQEKGSVQVKIYGTEYPIKSEEDPDYIQKIAQYVDNRMHEISRGSTNSLPGVAILTAMEIAHELHKEREGKESDASVVDDRLAGLIRLLDRVLETPTET
ncbi:uncharacterized protein METZ01_LOCUS173079 [marine metagenome]|uniref:Cell division protein ZapA n=1 Tax=marine metagenome TaxID=408172 RepID=A0A382C2C0_9ZZZZ